MTAIILAGLSVAVAVASVVGRVLAPQWAVRACKCTYLRRWLVSCGLAALWRYALAGVATLWLVVLGQTTWYGTSTGTILGSVLVGGLLAGVMVSLIQSGLRPFWRIVHDTLNDALPSTGPQRAAFNEDHYILLGSGGDPNTALQRILGC